MDDSQIIRRAHMLYRTLPGVGFSSTTFEELGRAIAARRSMNQLSAPLRGILLILTRDFCDALATLDVEELLAAESIQEETVTHLPPVVKTAAEVRTEVIAAETIANELQATTLEDEMNRLQNPKRTPVVLMAPPVPAPKKEPKDDDDKEEAEESDESEASDSDPPKEEERRETRIREVVSVPNEEVSSPR